MDQDEIQDPKLEARKAALEARRARLCDYADMVLNIIEALPAPDTLISAGRAVRVAAALDRFFVRLYSEPNLRQVASLEREVRRLVTPEPAPAPPPELTREDIEARAEQAEVTLQATRLALERKLQRYFQSLPRKPETNGSAMPLSTAPPSDETPARHSEPPNSHMSGDATPAPKVAKKDLAKSEPPSRSGPSIRSLGPDWPPWPPR